MSHDAKGVTLCRGEPNPPRCSSKATKQQDDQSELHQIVEVQNAKERLRYYLPWSWYPIGQASKRFANVGRR